MANLLFTIKVNSKGGTLSVVVVATAVVVAVVVVVSRHLLLQMK
jgi:hypothetical protein